MRVLHVIPSLAARIGGPAVSVVESSLALRALGIESTIIATDMAEAVSAKHHRRVCRDELPPGAELLDVHLVPARWPQRIAFSPAMYGAVGRELPRCDVLHIHMLFMFPQLAAFLQARRHHMPYVVSPCGALDPHLRTRSFVAKKLTDVLWQRHMLNRAAALHCKTAAEERLVDDLDLRAPRVVVPNGIDWHRFQRLPPREQFRRAHCRGFDGPLVLFLGRLSHKKGIDILIRAMPAILREFPQARLVIAGPDDERLRPRLEALAVAEGVSTRISFPGMLRGDEKLAALAAADVWTLSSHSENFGVAAVEAMAASLPAVISPAVNIAPDVATAGAAVIAKLTPEAFARDILTLLRDPARRTELATRARTFARRYDWGAVAPHLADLYAGVAAGRYVEALHTPTGTPP